MLVLVAGNLSFLTVSAPVVAVSTKTTSSGFNEAKQAVLIPIRVMNPLKKWEDKTYMLSLCVETTCISGKRFLNNLVNLLIYNLMWDTVSSS